MIISHRYKYVFIELPLTASTAIAKELKENYQGEEILHKHANYRKFLKQASSLERKYFPFVGVRNPLDQVVSHYHKYQIDHNNRFTEPLPRSTSKVKHWMNSRTHKKRFELVNLEGASFERFFLESYSGIYTDWSVLDKDKMKAIVRFENLQEDFSMALELVGIDQKAPLPQVNRTESKTGTFWDYYDTEKLRIHAAKVFGPFMMYWGYEFPSHWNFKEYQDAGIRAFNRINTIKAIYWKLA